MRIYILCARAREVVRGRNCFPITTGYCRFPSCRSEVQEAALRAILLLSLRALMLLYRYCSSLSSTFFFSLIFLFFIPHSSHFEIMTRVDTDYRRGIRPRMTRLFHCIENEFEGPIIHQILPIARNREGESEDCSDMPGSPAVSLAIAVSDYSRFFSSENF